MNTLKIVISRDNLKIKNISKYKYSDDILDLILDENLNYNIAHDHCYIYGNPKQLYEVLYLLAINHDIELI